MATERAAGRADRTSGPEDGKRRRNRSRELAKTINRERYRNDPGYREKAKEQNRERNRERYRNDPGYRAKANEKSRKQTMKRREAAGLPPAAKPAPTPEEQRAATNARLRERYRNDPEYREKRRERSREQARKRSAEKRDEIKAKDRERIRELRRERYRNDPEFRELCKERSREQSRKKREAAGLPPAAKPRRASRPPQGSAPTPEEQRAARNVRQRERYRNDPIFREKSRERAGRQITEKKGRDQEQGAGPD